MSRLLPTRWSVTTLALLLAFAVGYLMPRPAEPTPLDSLSSGQSGTLATGRSSHGPNRSGKSAVSASKAQLQSLSSSTDGFAARIGVTPEDWAATKAMNERADRGDYVLRFQRQTTRKFLEYDFKEVVAETARESSAEYDQIISQLGIDPAIGEQLKLHVSQIHQASLEAKVAIQQLISARNDYDTRLRSLLNESDYSSYRQHEETKPARRELADFGDFLSQKGMLLDSSQEQLILNAIRGAQAYSKRSSHGPFDGLPEPAIGKEHVLARLSRDQAHLVERANDLFVRASQDGVTAEALTLLQSYYSHVIEHQQAQIDRVKNPKTNPWPDDLP